MESVEAPRPAWQRTPRKQLPVIVRLFGLISIFGRAAEMSLNSHLNVSEIC